MELQSCTNKCTPTPKVVFHYCLIRLYKYMKSETTFCRKILKKDWILDRQSTVHSFSHSPDEDDDDDDDDE